jgi:hypothetical protein
MLEIEHTKRSRKLRAMRTLISITSLLFSLAPAFAQTPAVALKSRTTIAQLRLSRTNQAGIAFVQERRKVGMSTAPVVSPLRVTFDSNVWQMAIMPSLASKTELFADFVTIHDGLKAKQIQGFISETVGTLEAIRNVGRKAYFTSIKPKVNVQVINATSGQALLKIEFGTTHDQHPGLHRVLEERLGLAIALGMRLMRAPV